MDTMDFVKRAWATLDLSSPFTPTLSVEELDKRIADLRAVEQWLALNQGMLRNTIQGLEIQRGTLAAVRNLSDSFGRMTWPPGEETAEALARFAAAAAGAPQSPPANPFQSTASSVAGRPEATPRPEGTRPKAILPDAPSSDAAPPDATGPGGDSTPQPPGWGGSIDPLAWWKVLQGNFEQIARMATESASRTAFNAASDTADAAAPDARSAKAPSGRRGASGKSPSRKSGTKRTGTKPAPRRKGRPAADGAPATAGASADAKSREER